MAAVRTEDKVIDIEHVSHTYGGGFLTGRQVRRAWVVVFHAVVSAGRFYQLQHGFEFADHDHVVVNAFQIVLGEVLRLELFLDRLFVLIDRNRGEGDLTGFPHLFRVDILRLRHNI